MILHSPAFHYVAQRTSHYFIYLIVEIFPDENSKTHYRGENRHAAPFTVITAESSFRYLDLRSVSSIIGHKNDEVKKLINLN